MGNLYSSPLTSLKVIVSINELTVIPIIIGHSDVNHESFTTLAIKITVLISFKISTYIVSALTWFIRYIYY
jgi:hypothetical protein